MQDGTMYAFLNTSQLKEISCHSVTSNDLSETVGKYHHIVRLLGRENDLWAWGYSSEILPNSIHEITKYESAFIATDYFIAFPP